MAIRRGEGPARGAPKRETYTEGGDTAATFGGRAGTPTARPVLRRPLSGGGEGTAGEAWGSTALAPAFGNVEPVGDHGVAGGEGEADAGKVVRAADAAEQRGEGEGGAGGGGRGAEDVETSKQGRTASSRAGSVFQKPGFPVGSIL